MRTDRILPLLAALPGLGGCRAPEAPQAVVCPAVGGGEVTPLQRLCWGAHNRIPWLLRADRVQTLRPHGDGTLYETVDTIGGLLLPVVSLLFGRSLTRGFDGVARELKRRVESG